MTFGPRTVDFARFVQTQLLAVFVANRDLSTAPAGLTVPVKVGVSGGFTLTTGEVSVRP